MSFKFEHHIEFLRKLFNEVEVLTSVLMSQQTPEPFTLYNLEYGTSFFAVIIIFMTNLEG